MLLNIRIVVNQCVVDIIINSPHFIIVIIMSSINEQLDSFPTYPNKENIQFSEETADKQKYYQTHLQNKNEEDFDHIQITSPTQNIVSDDSLLFQQQKKKCMSCMGSQKKLQIVRNQLQNQKKKNLKYLKIINTKIDKEKELQTAYYQIAKELKKKIDAAQNYQIQQMCKEKQQNYHASSQNYRIPQTIKQQLNKQLRYISKNIDEEFHFAKQQQIHKFTIVSFEIICFKGVQENNQGFRPQENNKIKIYKKLNEQRSSDEELEIQKFLLKKQQQLKRANKSQKESYGTVEQWQSQHFYSISNNSISLAKQIQQIQNNPPKLQKEKKKPHLRQESSYYTIQQDLQIVEISNVSINNSLGIQQTDRKSQNSFLNQLKSQKSQKKLKIVEEEHIQKQVCKQKNFVQKHSNEVQLIRQIDQQRQKIKHFVLNIKQFLQKLNNQLNLYGYKYKIYSKLPRMLTNYGLIATNKPIHLQDLFIQKDKIQEILQIFTQHLQKTFKRQSKQYEKMLNDKDLVIYDIQNKVSELQSQKKESKKIIQNYQMHKEVLQIQFLQLQQKANGFSCQIRQPSTNRSDYVSQLKKRVSIMISERSKNKQIQCDLLSQELLNKRQILQLKNHQLTEALNQVPIILNQICAKKQINETFTINFQNNLQNQLSEMLRSSYQHLKTEQTNSHQIHSAHSITRGRSASLSPYLIRKRSQNYQLNILESENRQLKNILQQKSQQLLKYSQKISLYKIQKSDSDARFQELLIKLQQLNELNKELQFKKCNHSVLKNEISQQRIKYFRSSAIGSQKGQFIEYQQKKEYNNLYWDRDQQLKQLKAKLQKYQDQLKQFRLQNKKKKKIIYIDK